MTDRELLTALHTFIRRRSFITMENASLTDMVQRYKNPPLTALNRVAMQMTAQEFNALNDLMQAIDDQLKAEEAHVS